ncbi:MAG: protoporphyrinogen oxidase [Rudanella sp.]|nr:protoporphyrinogen oxidase [Rudanella sp.]
MSVGIIGAGISGLTLAWELQQVGVDYQLFEASGQVGGYIQSERTGPYLRELGPNSLLGDQKLLDWLDNLGLTDDLEFAKPVSKVRYIFRDGQYRVLPSGPPSLVFGSYFSWRTKWAVFYELMFRECSNRTISPPGETLAQFFRRRFSDEIVDYALGPFVAGIYAGDPEQLLVSETFPILLQYERDYGSVLRGLIKNQSGERRQSFSFREGMQTLPRMLKTKLTHLSLNTPVTAFERLPTGQWQLTTSAGPSVFDTLVLATATEPAARLLQSAYPTVAGAIRKIEYPPMTAVHSAYKRADVKHALNGFGGLNPAKESRFCAGHIWSSSTFETRCPADEVLFTTFVGGKQGERPDQPNNAQQSDDVILGRVHAELAASFGISALAPVWRKLTRWERAIPQYDAHLSTTKPLIASLEPNNLFVCANWYGGVSLSDCIRKGRELGERLAGRE